MSQKPPSYRCLLYKHILNKKNMKGYRVKLGEKKDEAINLDQVKLVTISMRTSEYLKLKSMARANAKTLSGYLVSQSIKS